MRGFGPTAQKVILLLLGGLALGLSGSPNRYKRVLKSISRDWKQIERRNLYRGIRQLYESRLVNYVENKDGTVSVVLNRDGRKVALKYKIGEMKILKPPRWDYKWRVVLFDIPQTQAKLRDALRQRFKQLGLIEFQKSVFIHPYECRNEIDFVIELYNARRFVRFIEATKVDNELHLKNKFRLS
ncbi:MAG: hypothetical protein HYT98_00505 [Candidatus Sungbacteria bacterium]|nr:hypothetical protein [Candidatus Sungbacteria bacterium]